MIIQIEDCMDCLKAIHWECYDYLFIFDHSNGHDCLSPDALSPTQIRKEFGGKQPFMRLSVIENEFFIGPYSHNTKLKVSNTHFMTF